VKKMGEIVLGRGISRKSSRPGKGGRDFRLET